MPITMQHERDNIFRVELHGTLRKIDFQRSQQQLTGEMQRIGTVKLLFLLEEFDGWEMHASWNDLSFYVKNGDRIERIAIVGPERWRSEALMFAGADLRRAAVEFFREDALADARTWLSS
ncbi:MAG: STAS/SEC14 domain-containing protein [Vicinamibacterales bacterium]